MQPLHWAQDDDLVDACICAAMAAKSVDAYRACTLSKPGSCLTRLMLCCIGCRVQCHLADIWLHQVLHA